MCGLWAYFLRPDQHHLLTSDTFNREIQKGSEAVANRGPDGCTNIIGDGKSLVFHRLAIHDTTNKGDQPFTFVYEDDVRVQLICNGEIYNYEHLIEKFELAKMMTSRSDCEVLCHLLHKQNYRFDAMLPLLDGEFAIVCLVDQLDEDGKTTDRKIYAARDPYGVRPLYWAEKENGVCFSSHLAGCDGGHHFEPGHIICIEPNFTIHSKPFYIHPFKADKQVWHTDSLVEVKKEVSRRLVSAVNKRLSSDRHIGFLLSGGLDSSLVVAIAVKMLGIKAHTFSIGLPGSPDLFYAKKVAEFLGTEHHEVTFTVEEGLAAIPDVIKALGSYDITSIRASVGQFLLAKYISTQTDIKVILNGDGSDEACMGYLYFHRAPDAMTAHDESIKLLRHIHEFDGLRVDRCLGWHGLEARVPFLDPEFVDYYTSIHPSLRMPNKNNGMPEKWLLRSAFENPERPILPFDVLWRTKEAFSDGVSSQTSGLSWYQEIQKFVEGQIVNRDYKKYTVNTPNTKEAMYYREIFAETFPFSEYIVPYFWMPNWIEGANDPSARTLAVYAEV